MFDFFSDFGIGFMWKSVWKKMKIWCKYDFKALNSLKSTSFSSCRFNYGLRIGLGKYTCIYVITKKNLKQVDN